MSDNERFEKMMEDLNNDIQKKEKEDAIPSLFPAKVDALIGQIVDLTNELCKEMTNLDKPTVLNGFDDKYAKFKHVFTHHCLIDMVNDVKCVMAATSMTRSDADKISADTGDSIDMLASKTMMHMVMDIIETKK